MLSTWEELSPAKRDAEDVSSYAPRLESSVVVKHASWIEMLREPPPPPEGGDGDDDCCWLLSSEEDEELMMYAALLLVVIQRDLLNFADGIIPVYRDQ